MQQPTIPAPIPISQLPMAGGANPAPAATDLVPVAIYLPNKFGPGVGGYTTYQIEIENLSSLGPVGPPGPPGPGGPTGTQGPAGPGYKATSTSAFTPGTGAYTLVTQSGLAYLPGERVRASSAGTTNTFIEGPCQSYNPNANPPTIVIVADTFAGTGAHSDWNIGVGGTPGPQGPQGLPGTAGGAGGTNGQFQYNSSGNFGGVTLTGDISGVNLSNGVVTVNWANHPAFIASGASHAKGAVPDPGATAGTTRFLCENATWGIPPGNYIEAPNDGALYGRQSVAWAKAVKLSGDTMTGALTIGSGNLTLASGAAGVPAVIINAAPGIGNFIDSKKNNLLRWRVSIGDSGAESGSNAGSDFTITRYNDAGVPIDTPFIMARANGVPSFSAGAMSVYGGNGSPVIYLQKNSGAFSASIYGVTIGGGVRWVVQYGDSSPESSGNNGSNFSIGRYDNGGNPIDTPFIIQRSTGIVTYSAGATITPGAGIAPTFALNKPASGLINQFQGMTASIIRWNLFLGDAQPESGSGAGSDFQLARYTDAGGYVDSPITIQRSSGTIALGRTITGSIFDTTAYQVNMRLALSNGGINIRNTTAGTTGFAIAFTNSANTTVGTISQTDTATIYATSSDRRLKEDIENFSRGRELVDQLQVRSFTWKTNHLSDVGLIAQEAVHTFPQAVNIGSGEPDESGFRPWGVDYAKYVPLLIQALQDAHKRIDELEQRIAELE